ncbi:MAG: DoxX family protein [Myxococcales bacterium]|nr:DoxX family protein [Myxococcales bacterium]
MNATTLDRDALSAPQTSTATHPLTLWAGRILTALAGLGLVSSAAMKLRHGEEFVGQWVGHLGFREASLGAVGVVELVCALLYLTPQTSVLGTLLTLAYLGGATAAHVRIGESPTAPIVLGVLAVAGLWLRDPRVRALLPLKRA